jgi:hypothetical protein
VQYTIEARQLTIARQRSSEKSTQQMVVEARSAGEALSHFVRADRSELVSYQPVRGRESIATVKKNDSVFLVRVYAA